MRIYRIIAALAGLSQRVLHLFGVFPVVTGIRMLVMAEKAPDLEKNPVLRLAHRHLRIHKDYHGEKFTVVKDGVRYFSRCSWC